MILKYYNNTFQINLYILMEKLTLNHIIKIDNKKKTDIRYVQRVE